MIKLDKLQIRYGETVVVSDISLEVAEGEFFTLLGPSGCGKTTILRAIAGFVPVAGGEILINGQDVSRQTAEERDVGIVFQNYALFPHMSVYENVAFGLRMARKPNAALDEAVRAMLESTGISEHAEKKPEALSGGQQQRVAIARSLVMGTRVLLFDEPLSNLDAKIRETMRSEIKRLQRELGFTAIFVTHDQEEALALSDRLVVLDGGAVQQVGTGPDLYDNPRNPFVCQFIGDASELSPTWVLRHFPSVTLAPETRHVFVRPEAWKLSFDHFPDAAQATILDYDFLGILTRFRLGLDGQELTCSVLSDSIGGSIDHGQKVYLALPAGVAKTFAT